MTTTIDTAESIKALRKANGLTQEELAEMARLNRITIAKYESGVVEPGAQALARIADALGVSTDEVLGRQPVNWKVTIDGMKIHDMLQNDPEMRSLVIAASKSSHDHIRVATTVLQALDKAV